MPIFLEPMFWPRADVWQDLQITNSSLPLPDKNKVGSNFYLEPFVQVSHTKDFSKNLAWYSALLCKQRQKQLYNIKNSYYFLLVPKMDILLKAGLKISKHLFWKTHSENFLENAQNDRVLYVNIVDNTE